MAKIGIMGGTFDPIHNAHLMLGRQALKEYHLDEIWFMPSHNPPHKTDHRVTGTKDRCEMVKLAIAGEPRFRFSDFEISRAGNTYTAQTLKLLKEAYPKHTFFFIVGADSLYHIESWYHPEEVMRQVTILAAGRECEDASCTLEEQAAYLIKKYGAAIFLLHSDSMEVSSQELREREMNGGRIHNLVPENVERYIEEHGLYQNPEKL
ncbi:nicotinate-nucleotide adenylyltransferase [Clostridium sp. OM02-18AC]|uniref:nicotinate-nucleotide adenylyltransferase n=1 Tax=Clostridium sp. OM02-18AC TaxID=2292311 RepID=UPI000E4D1D5F|nr:nicotinate-nucleotide adenylyltransferase [Clostridium sp. OM02-18AC]RHV68289.1 nicotinate-nucleotide adenylyltransferase [Clostridium sp. OM02-18AC]